MPAVAIVSPKGGAGKSTAAVLLGTEMAHAGVPVTMMDCDPNRSLTALLHESSLARTMPTDRILTGRCDMTLVGRTRSSD